MTELLRCDQCERESPDPPADPGWVSVELVNDSSLRLGDDPSERHFCSETCIGAFYGARVWSADPVLHVTVTLDGLNNDGSAGENDESTNDFENIQGGSGSDSLVGNSGKNEINGGDGNDYMIGGNGNDTLRGDLGSDTMHGGNGNDLLYAGLDNYVINFKGNPRNVNIAELFVTQL